MLRGLKKCIIVGCLLGACIQASWAGYNTCGNNVVSDSLSSCPDGTIPMYHSGQAPASTASTLNWGAAQTFTINSPYGGIVNGPPDDSTGGFSFANAAMTRYGSVADIVIGNDGTIGATGIALSQAGLDSTSDTDPGTYLSYLRIKNVGDVFVIKLKNGKHAKIRIDSLPAGIAWFTYSSISFSYRLEGNASPATISNARLFAYAEGNFPSIFAGSITSGQYLQYNYRYYSTSRNYLAVDTAGGVYILGPISNGVIESVGTLASNANDITAWEATQKGNATPPSAPTGVTAVPGTGKIMVSWNAVAGATSYKVYASMTPSANALVGSTSGTSIVDMAPNNDNYYIVVAENANGSSAPSEKIFVTYSFLPAPTGVKASTAGSKVTINWADVLAADSYNVYWSSSPGVTTSSTLLGNVSATSASFTLKGSANYFMIAAVDIYGIGAPSAEVSVPNPASSIGTWSGSVTIEVGSTLSAAQGAVAATPLQNMPYTAFTFKDNGTTVTIPLTNSTLVAGQVVVGAKDGTMTVTATPALVSKVLADYAAVQAGGTQARMQTLVQDAVAAYNAANGTTYSVATNVVAFTSSTAAGSDGYIHGTAVSTAIPAYTYADSASFAQTTNTYTISTPGHTLTPGTWIAANGFPTSNAFEASQCVR